MPGLQSIVSAWTKINHGHVEYFGQGDQGPSDAAGNLASAVVASAADPGGGGAGGGGAPLAGGRGTPWRNDAADDRPPTPPHELPANNGLISSSSSLSSFSFAAVGNVGGGPPAPLLAPHYPPGGGAPGGAAAAPPTVQRRPSQLQYYGTGSNAGGIVIPSSSLSSVGFGPGGADALAAAMGGRPPSSPPPRGGNANYAAPPAQLTTTTTTTSAMSAQLVHPRGAAPRQPLPFQYHRQYGGGAAALGGSSARGGGLPSAGGSAGHGRSSGASSASSSNHHNAGNFNNYDASHVPPPQAGADAILGRRRSVNGGFPAAATTPMNLSSAPMNAYAEAAGDHRRSCSSSTTSSSSSQMKRSPATSLWHSERRVNGNLLPFTQQRNNTHLVSSSSSTTMMMMMRQQQQQQQQYSYNNQTVSSSNSVSGSSLKQPTPIMPIPVSSRKQRLKKSHSRTDLVREMALDRNKSVVPQHRASSSSGTSSATVVANGGGLINDETTDAMSTNSTISHQEQRHQDISQLAKEELQRRQWFFLHGKEEEEQGELGRTSRSRSDAQSSTLSDSLRPIQPQQHRHEHFLNGDGNAASSGAGGPDDSYAHNRGDWPDPTTNTATATAAASIGQTLFSPASESDLRRRSRYSSSAESSETAVTANISLMTMMQLGGGITGGVNGAMNGEMMHQPLHSSAAPAPFIPSKQPQQQLQQQQQHVIGKHNQLPPQYGNEGGEDYYCNRCAQMESALLSVQADLEYLRTLELQREVSVAGNNNSGSSSNSHAAATMTPTLFPPIAQKAAYLNPTSKNLGLLPSSSSVSSAVSIGSRGSSLTGSLFYNRRRTWQQQQQQNHQQQQQQQSSAQKRTTYMFLCDASKRLKDLSTRHKQQVKQSTHERAYCQYDMHLKLEKFAMMCKNLNEEAALRNNEVKETKALLDKMTNERNTLSSQIDALRAQVELYEGKRAAQSRIRKEWEEEKARLLDVLNGAIRDRDEIVDDVSRRLDLAAETIESERRQHLMRRQIIFPGSRQQQPLPQLDATINYNKSKQSIGGSNNSSAHSSPHLSPHLSYTGVEDYLDRTHKQKEIVHKAQLSLKAAMVQSALRERDMQSRLDGLERLLNLNETQRAMAAMSTSDGKKGDAMEGALNGNGSDGGGMVHARRISSSKSL